MVDRLTGAAPDSIRHELVDETGADLSEKHGPYLVALCAASPSAGDPLLDRYLGVHATYPYQPYRRRSLWRLLPAILAHPDRQWVRQRLIDVAIAALAAADVEFFDSIESAALAALAGAGDRQAETELSRQREAALAAARACRPNQSAARETSGGRTADGSSHTPRRQLASTPASSSPPTSPPRRSPSPVASPGSPPRCA